MSKHGISKQCVSWVRRGVQFLGSGSFIQCWHVGCIGNYIFCISGRPGSIYFELLSCFFFSASHFCKHSALSLIFLYGLSQTFNIFFIFPYSQPVKGLEISTQQLSSTLNRATSMLRGKKTRSQGPWPYPWEALQELFLEPEEAWSRSWFMEPWGLLQLLQHATPKKPSSSHRITLLLPGMKLLLLWNRPQAMTWRTCFLRCSFLSCLIFLRRPLTKWGSKRAHSVAIECTQAFFPAVAFPAIIVDGCLVDAGNKLSCCNKSHLDALLPCGLAVACPLIECFLILVVNCASKYACNLTVVRHSS